MSPSVPRKIASPPRSRADEGDAVPIATYGSSLLQPPTRSCDRDLSQSTDPCVFYCVRSSGRKSAWTFVRQLRGPHFSSVQFHLESVLTQDSERILASMLAETEEVLNA